MNHVNPQPEDTNPAEMAERYLALETGFANAMMRAAREFLSVQALVQREDVPSLRAHLRDAAEIRLEVVFGPHPHIRMVTVDHDGGDAVLLRRLDLAPLSGMEH